LKNKPLLPANLELMAKKAIVAMRHHPHIIHNDCKDILNVSEGLVTIIDPGDSPFLEAGMMFILDRREIIAEKIKENNEKYRGSESHHKFLVIVNKGKILVKNNTIYAT
jgi:hypothetical protein